MTLKHLAAAGAVALIWPGHAHAQGMDHSAHAAMPGSEAGALPSEPGDATFAAIAEIVALLSADPDTDWDRVDIDALRRHLVDMTRLMEDAEVTGTPVPGGLSMRIATDGRGGEAARRMVPAHAPILAAETGWTSDLTEEDGGIVWLVRGNVEDARRIRALGFFGLMATGDHHKAHHIALARGQAG